LLTSQRSEARDGLDNRLEGYVLTHFKPAWRFIQRRPRLERWVNKTLINRLIYKIPTRPYAVSTMAEYTSWDSLTDRTFTGRHLPPVPAHPEGTRGLPDVEDVVKLFERPPGKPVLSSKSTMLFAYFAQWFTDGFLRTDRENNLKNTSNHDIDLCQLYGLTRTATHVLRSYEGGRLKSQVINGEEYPCYYYGEHGKAKPEFEGLPIITMPGGLDSTRQATLFAMGLDRGNVQVGYVMFNTLFLREHNRICGLLSHAYPSWDDERLFQTARNITIVMLIKVVVDEYINHIAPYNFKFKFDAAPFWNERWYRQNWMSLEFSLVYRWHGLVPDHLRLGGRDYPAVDTLFNNALLTERGLGALFEDASLQPAGEICLFNTPAFLLDTERASIQLGRLARLAGYNDYRELCGYPRVTAFDQITGNPAAQRMLADLYGHVDNVEFYVGLTGEDVRPNSALSPLMGRLVGIDAFSQALTNPLLSQHVFNERTFSPLGLKLITQTSTLSDIVHRNVPDRSRRYRVTMTQRRAGPTSQ
jgi:prostaglandin-endoperoxide synthase 2